MHFDLMFLMLVFGDMMLQLTLLCTLHTFFHFLLLINYNIFVMLGNCICTMPALSHCLA